MDSTTDTGAAGTTGTGGTSGAAQLYDGRFISYQPSTADQQVIFGHKHAFLHQSTGQYILDAMPGVAGFASPDFSKIRNIQWQGQYVGNGISEQGLTTADIHQKVDDFAAFVRTGTNGSYYETLLFKYCFQDQWSTSNPQKAPEEILAYYKTTLSTLRGQYPKAKFVHVTWPIYENPGWTQPDNTLHGRYNQLLRAEYGGKEPIFDLADIEATKADGSKCTFVDSATGTSWPILCDGEALPDHGHPGPAVSGRLARVFLYMLNDLYR